MSSNGAVKANDKDGLTEDTLNPNVLAAEYAVRGAIAIKAANYNKQLKSGEGSLPFDKVYACNIGMCTFKHGFVPDHSTKEP